jgi:hypothetical protein
MNKISNYNIIMITSLIIAFIITFIICLLVNIRSRDIVLVAAISALVVLILEKLYDTDKNLTNLMLNTNLSLFPSQSKDIINHHESLQRKLPRDCGYNGCPIDRLTPKKYGEIIPEDMYNPEDCTSDGSCIQKPDVNNMFPMNNDIKRQIKSLDFKIAKIENNVKNMKNDDGIFVEHFENSRSPQELNDTILPFNKTIIKPYESSTQQATGIEGQEMMETDGICFHGKVGSCEGGVCRSVEAQNVPGVNTHSVEQSNIALSAHPYTDDQPLIRLTNPGHHDFE